MICDKRTSIVLPFSESKMFPRGEERESERQMEDRELENICKSSIYSKVGEGREIQFSWRKSTRPGRNSKSFNPPPPPRQFAVLIEADAALMKRSNRVFRLKNGPLEKMKSSLAQGCFLRSRYSINSLFFFSTSHVELVVSRIEYTPFDYPRFLNPFFDTSPDSSSTLLLSLPISR